MDQIAVALSTWRQLFLSQLRVDPKLVQFIDACLRWKTAEIVASDVLVLPSTAATRLLALCSWRLWRPAGLPWLLTSRARGWVGSAISGLPWSQQPAGLAENMQLMADQPQMRNQMALKSRDRYINLFARSVWLKQLSNFGARLKTGKVSSCTE